MLRIARLRLKELLQVEEERKSPSEKGNGEHSWTIHIVPSNVNRMRSHDSFRLLLNRPCA